MAATCMAAMIAGATATTIAGAVTIGMATAATHARATTRATVTASRRRRKTRATAIATIRRVTIGTSPGPAATTAATERAMITARRTARASSRATTTPTVVMLGPPTATATATVRLVRSGRGSPAVTTGASPDFECGFVGRTFQVRLASPTGLAPLLQFLNQRVDLLILQTAGRHLRRRRAAGNAPAVVLLDRLGDRRTLGPSPDERLQPRAHCRDAGVEPGKVRLSRYRPVARDDEVEFERPLEGARPLDQTATLHIVDVDRHTGPRAADEQIAGVNGLQLGEIDDRVAAGVAPAEVVRLDVPAAQMHVQPIAERDSWQTDRRAWRVLVVRPLQVLQVRVHVAVRDHFGDRQHLEIAAGVIVVLVRVDHIPQRSVGDELHLGEDVGVVAVEHVVHQDDALGGGVDRDIAALAGDHVQVTLHALSLK